VTRPRDPHLELAPLCAAAAVGRRDALAPLARAAIAAGCGADEVREALLTLAPFCGYPRTLDAIGEVRALLPATSRPASAPESAARGAAFFDVVYGDDAVRVRENLRALDPEVAGWIERDAYGKVLSRGEIPASLRERIGVVLLVAQGLRKQLSGHLRGAMHFGATTDEVAAFLAAASPFLDAGEVAFANDTLTRVAGARGDGGAR
jgi:4-carboxymuconolactone decarboxylase